MTRRTRSKNRAYHDRVAGIYDGIYEGSPYWRFWRDVVWKRTRARLAAPPADVLEAGGGTGHFGLRLARAGYRTTISDLSLKMCDAAAQKAAELPASRRPAVVQADLADLAPFGDDAFDAVVAVGDVWSFVPDSRAALRAVGRVLRPGGLFCATVDSVYGALDHFCAAGDVAKLERFLKDGRTEFLAKKAEERFPTRAFTPAQVRTLAAQEGFEVAQLAPLLALPMRAHRTLLDDPAVFQRLLKLELKLGDHEALLGNGGHLFVALQRSAGTAGPA